LSLGLYPVNDPQAVRNPRPDVSYYTPVGVSGGDGGSRDIQWGWNPVGLNNPLLLSIPSDLIGIGSVGTVLINPPPSINDGLFLQDGVSLLITEDGNYIVQET
jgi:hypothetical protein